MKISDLFDIKYGVNLELQNCDVTDDESGINFVARTSQNNGVVAKVKKIDGIEPQPAGTISCAAGGSVLSTFVQVKPYYSGRDLYILIPKKEMSLNEKLYYAMCINKNAYKYNYGRQANTTLKDIIIPDSIPKWVTSTKIDENILKTNFIKSKDLDFNSWKSFKLNEIFKIVRCKCGNAGDLIDGDDIYYIGAKKTDNGIMKRVKKDETLITKGNCIVFIGDGQGSVGYSNYMDKDFIGSTTLAAGYNDNLNKYNGLFLVTVLDLERIKYNYGRKYLSNLLNTEINLPVNNLGEPNWEYMESYIKSLPYADKI